MLAIQHSEQGLPTLPEIGRRLGDSPTPFELRAEFGPACTVYEGRFPADGATTWRAAQRATGR